MQRSLVSHLMLCMALALPMAAAAGDPKPFPDFTFKRMTPPKPGAGRRITVQISPQAPTPRAEAVAPDAPAASGYDWYWADVSPDLAASGPGRLPGAVQQLKKGAVPAPRLQEMQDIAALYGPQILAATIGTQVSPALALAVIGIESAGRSAAVSQKGATGLMQLMPDTATRFGAADSTDPGQNIRAGVLYLDWLMRKFDRDPILVLAGYNAGENAVLQHQGVPPYPETRAYVPKVLAAWTVARGLCVTPPELVTDGCAFAVRGAVTDG